MTASRPMVAVQFPGQGAQRVGMGADLLASEPAVARAFERADKVLGYDLAAFCLGGPPHELASTYRAQPALFTLGVGVWQAMEERGVQAGCAVGHSIGEFSAWVVAGALHFDQALALVQKRAELMQAASERHEGAMSAVLGLPDERVEELCKQAGEACQPAAYNCPGQVVISGQTRSVEAVERQAAQEGARTIRLGVSGAFHSPLMADADGQFRAEVDAAQVSDARIPVAANATGCVVTKADDIRSAMRSQMLSPVRWQAGIKALIDAGAQVFVEVGPGGVLAGLLKRIDRAAKGLCVQDRASFDEALAFLAA